MFEGLGFPRNGENRYVLAVGHWQQWKQCPGARTGLRTCLLPVDLIEMNSLL